MLVQVREQRSKNFQVLVKQNSTTMCPFEFVPHACLSLFSVQSHTMPYLCSVVGIALDNNSHVFLESVGPIILV